MLQRITARSIWKMLDLHHNYYNMFEWFERLVLPTATPDVAQSLVVIMVTISLGVFMGRLKIGRVTLGVSGVLFSGILLGHFKYQIDEVILNFIRDFGLIIFVYGVGIQVGPTFFSSFRKVGLTLNLLAAATVLLGGLVTFLLHWITGVGMDHMVGVMSGSVTNTPGLAAAKSTLAEASKHLVGIRFSDPTIAYAITYPLGVAVIIVAIIIAKNLLKIDNDKEMLQYKAAATRDNPPVIHRKCRVTNSQYYGLSIDETLEALDLHSIIISRLKHSGSKTVFSPTSDVELRKKDVLMVVGKATDVDMFIAAVGKESTDLFIESEAEVLTAYLYVTQKTAWHRTIAELQLDHKFDLSVTRVYRSGLELLASPDLELFYGDKLKVVGSRDSISEVEAIIGNAEKRLLEPDFLSIFGGLLLGIVLGSIPIFIPNLPVPLKLGFAAGPLLTALFVSRYGGIGVIHSFIHHGAVHFMKDLGICLFFAAVGIHAGAEFYENFIRFDGWTWLAYGIIITMLPLILLIVVARYYLKMNFIQLTGLISGTYTDPAALSFCTSYFDSDIPSQSYATVYPLVTILRIFVAQFLVLLCCY